MKRSSHVAGFTLIELMIVVAIIAAVMAMSVYSIQSSRQRVSVDRAASRIKTSIERARALTARIGPRLGTARVTADGTCPSFRIGPVPPNPPNPYFDRQLWVTIDAAAGTVEVPQNVTYNPGTDVMTVGCELINLNDITIQYAGTQQPRFNANQTFMFTPSGRVVNNFAAPTTVTVLIDNPTDQTVSGFRIMPSGVVCSFSRKNLVAGQDPCDGTIDGTI